MQEATWTGVIVSLIALAGTIANSIFTRSANRDRLQFDQKVHTLENQVREQGDKVKECEDDRADLRVEVKKCREEHEKAKDDRNALEVRVAHLEEQVVAAAAKADPSTPPRSPKTDHRHPNR